MNSMSLYITRGVLLASGLIATCIALMILLAPGAFYAGYGIDTSGDVNLVNELKAPAGALLLAGLFMMAGIFKPKLTVPSLAVAATVYLSYGLSRILSVAIDGVPHGGLVSAAVIELAIGVICITDLVLHRKKSAAALMFTLGLMQGSGG